MACAVCEHCNSTIQVGEESIQGGFSYHNRCKKCYVCSETNLRNAEVCKGIIFCSRCSRRIFRGCCTARRVKTKGKRQNNRRPKRRPRRVPVSVIKLARLNSALTSDSDTEKSKLSNHVSDVTTVLKKPQTVKEDLKKESIELGASTEIAHVALRRRSEVPVIIQSESALRKATSKRMSYITQESEYNIDETQCDEDEKKYVMPISQRNQHDTQEHQTPQCGTEENNYDSQSSLQNFTIRGEPSNYENVQQQIELSQNFVRPDDETYQRLLETGKRNISKVIKPRQGIEGNVEYVEQTEPAQDFDRADEHNDTHQRTLETVKRNIPKWIKPQEEIAGNKEADYHFGRMLANLINKPDNAKTIRGYINILNGIVCEEK